MKKHHILFLLLFILMTFAPVPVFSLFRERIGYKNTENKAESSFPGLDLQNYSTWPRRFEEWLSDTLPFKTQFIELFRGFQFRTGLDYTQSDVIRGKEERLFYRTTVENYKGITRFTDAELETIGSNLEGFFSMMREAGTECLLLVGPDKEQVLDRYMPDNIRRISEESRADQTVAYLREHLSFPVLYPKAELIRFSQEHPVYFRTDTHWNELGGYIAAQEIKAAFTGREADIHIPAYHYFPEDGKDLASMLGLSEVIPEDNTVLIDWEDGVETHKVQSVLYGRVQRFTSNAPTHKKLMILGDSFSEYCLRSAIHDVDEVLFVTYGQLSMIDLEEEDPDLLVVMLVERNLPFLLNGFY